MADLCNRSEFVNGHGNTLLVASAKLKPCMPCLPCLPCVA